MWLFIIAWCGSEVGLLLVREGRVVEFLGHLYGDFRLVWEGGSWSLSTLCRN